MVETIIKTLNKLKYNIKKYQVKYYTYNYCNIKEQINFKYNDQILTINYCRGKEIVYYIDNIGACVTIYNLDEIDDCEIRKLFAIIKRNCEDYTSNQIKIFADSENSNETDF